MDALKLFIIATNPFFEKYNAAMKPKESNPPFGRWVISRMVSCSDMNMLVGRIFPIISNSESWKFGTGMYGIKVNRKIMEGNTARKKLNAIDAARACTCPLKTPRKKKAETS